MFRPSCPSTKRGGASWSFAGNGALLSTIFALIAHCTACWAVDVVAPHAIPPFANSAMDGYALRGVDLPAATGRSAFA